MRAVHSCKCWLFSDFMHIKRIYMWNCFGRKNFHFNDVQQLADSTFIFFSENVSRSLNQPFDCNMRADDACGDIIAMWTVGSSGSCLNPNVGFKIGATGYRLGAIEVHANTRW